MPVRGFDQDDSYGDNDDGDSSDIADWMAGRQADIDSRDQNAAGFDPTNGALHFNVRGPLKNSFTKGDAPWPCVYSNTYQDE